MRQDALPSLRVTRSHVANGKPNAGRHSIAAIQHGDDSSIAFVRWDDLQRQESLSIADTLSLQAIASSDHLELVDADLHLRSTLLFSEAFPNTTQRKGIIQAITVDDTTQRVRHVNITLSLYNFVN